MSVARRDALRGHAAMLAFSALVAGSFSLGSLVAGDVAPVALMAARFWLAAAVMGGLVLVTGRARPSDFRAPWRYLLLGGVFSAYFVLMFEGLKSAPPVSTSAVFTLMPVMSAGFGWVLLRQTTGGRLWLALALGAAGALWVIFRGDPAALMRLDMGRGEAIFLLGCVAHALYVPLVRMMNRGEGAMATSLGVLLGGALVLTLLGWREIVAVDRGALGGLVWAVLAYLVVFATAASFSLLQFAAMRLPAARVMAYTYLTPTWVIVWELALGHSAPPATVLGGIALSLAALGLLLRRPG